MICAFSHSDAFWWASAAWSNAGSMSSGVGRAEMMRLFSRSGTALEPSHKSISPCLSALWCQLLSSTPAEMILMHRISWARELFGPKSSLLTRRSPETKVHIQRPRTASSCAGSILHLGSDLPDGGGHRVMSNGCSSAAAVA